MSVLKLLAIYLVFLLIAEIFFFCIWLYIATKDIGLIDEYWFGVFNKKDISNLSKGQFLFSRVIYITRMSIVFLLVMEVISLFIKLF
jgi:steroid 5-alpha reductase family enzyme